MSALKHVYYLSFTGMRVVAVARRKDRLEELQRHMHAMGVPLVNFLPVVCDITKEAEVRGLMTKSSTHHC